MAFSGEKFPPTGDSGKPRTILESGKKEGYGKSIQSAERPAKRTSVCLTKRPVHTIIAIDNHFQLGVDIVAE